MSVVIKSGTASDRSDVRPFALPSSPPPLKVVQINEEEERLRARVAFLEGELHDRDVSIAALRSDVERSRQSGLAEGRKLGLAEAEDRQSDRLAMLQEALRTAQNELFGKISSLERIAMIMAEEALDIVFEDRRLRTDLLRRILEVQIARIDKAMLLSVVVSPDDYPDEQALAALQAELEVPGVIVQASPELSSGGCLMNLRLGKMDVGINQQWGALRDVLGDLALPEGAP